MLNDWVYPLGLLIAIVGAGGIGLLLQMRRASEQQQAFSLSEKAVADKTALETSKADVENRLIIAESAIQSYKEETLFLHGKVHHLEKDLAHLQEHLQEREQENSQLRQQTVDFQRSNQSLHQQFSQLEVFHEQFKVNHQNQIQEHQKEKDSLSLRLQQEMSKLADLRSQILILEQDQKRQKQQALQLQEWEKSQQDWLAEKAAFVAQKRSQLEQIQQLEQGLNREKETVKTLQAAIEPLQQAIAEQQSEQQQAIAVTETLNLQVQTLETEKTAWQDQERDLRQQLAKLEVLEQQTKTQIEALTTQVHSLERDRQQFVQAQSQWQSDRQNLETAQRNQDSAYQDLKTQFDALQQQWDQLNAERTRQESQLQAEQSKVIALEQQLLQRQARVTPPSASPAPESSAAPLETVETKVDMSQPATASKPTKNDGEKARKNTISEAKAPTHPSKTEPEAIQGESTPSSLPKSSGQEGDSASLNAGISRDGNITELDVAPVMIPEIVTEAPPAITPETLQTIEESSASHPETVPEITETEPQMLLAGKKFIILGTLSLIDRDRAKDLIQEAGGTLTSSPSAKTDYVLVGKAPGDKLKKAQKLGIAQLSEPQFLKLLGIES